MNAAAVPRWRQRPPGSNWGDFGADDQLGRVNLITPEQVRRGAAEVREGVTFCLSLPLDRPGGNLTGFREAPRLRPTCFGGQPCMNFPMGRMWERCEDVLCDDQVTLALQHSTQWDSLVHIGAQFDADGDGQAEMVYYNGYRAGVDVLGPVDHGPDGAETADGGAVSGARALGIEHMAVHGMQGRGVLVDLQRRFGREPRALGLADLLETMRQQDVVVEPGDMLLLRTGLAEVIMASDRPPHLQTLGASCVALNGRDDALLQWITDSGISALIADNFAVELAPALDAPGATSGLPLHHHCLFKLGLPLGELWYLRELGDWLHRHGRSRFLLTAPPLRLPGAVGSPATPVATV